MQIFTRNEHFIRKISIRYVDIVAGLAITQQGNIVAVDSVSPTVFCISESDDLLKWFDCSDYMREPSDIAIFNNEYFVCDFKESLPSSFSAPGAPNPSQIIINESEMDTEDGELEKMLIEKQKLEIMLNEKNDEINRYLSNLAKFCFLGIQINGKMYKDVIIQLFDEKAPLTCRHFRAVCTGKRGFDFQNTSLNYLVRNKYIQDSLLLWLKYLR